MFLEACVRLHSLWRRACERMSCGLSPTWRDDRGQTTAEYALVIVGAATVAVLLLAWATGSGKIGGLLDEVLDTVSGMLR